MKMHVPTMFSMIIAASGTLTFSVGWVARAKDGDGLRLWTVGLALQVFTFSLFSLRNKIPDIFSVLLANAALSTSFSFFLAAVCQFQQRRLRHALFWCPPVVLAVICSFFMNDIGARIIVSGVIFSTQGGLILVATLSRRYVVNGRGKYLLVSGMVVTIAVLLMRIVSVVFAPDSIPSMLGETPIQTMTFMMTFITLILMSNGFVLMTKERADERIRLLAMKDRLTGVWNRIRLEEAAQQEIARYERHGHPVALVIMDLDYFKRINDQFGHGTGDLVLREFCEVVLHCVRTTDIFGRWGGEEFLLLLPETDFASAGALAERIRAAVEQHEFSGGLRVTSSMGLATCLSGDTWDSWLDRADQALYRAKSAGRNRVESECGDTTTSRAQEYPRALLSV